MPPAPPTSLPLETLALRQQLSLLKRKNPGPKLTRCDRWFWIAVNRFWPEWKNSLLLVKPETVVQWHRRALRTYWRVKCKVGEARRKPISAELQQTIFRMARENPTSTPHPRRTADAWLRRLGTIYIALDGTLF